MFRRCYSSNAILRSIGVSLLFNLSSCTPPSEDQQWKVTREIFTTANALRPQIFQIHNPSRAWLTDSNGSHIVAFDDVSGKLSARKGRLDELGTLIVVKPPSRLANGASHLKPAKGQERIAIQFNRIERKEGTLRVYAILRMGQLRVPAEGIVRQISITKSRASVSGYIHIDSKPIIEKLADESLKEGTLHFQSLGIIVPQGS